MKWTVSIIFFLFCALSRGQICGKIDTVKLSLNTTSLIDSVFITEENIMTYEIKPTIHRHGIYKVFADSTFRILLYQTEFRENYKVGFDTYWYSNGNKAMEFETTETMCLTDVVVENATTRKTTTEVMCYRFTQKLGQYKSWYSDKKPKAIGKYILIDNCLSVKSGNWSNWDEKGKVTVTTH